MVAGPTLLAESGFLAAPADPAAVTAVIVWLAAAVPALVWACLLWRLARPAAAGASTAAALLAGAVLAAWPASQANQALFDGIADIAGDATARQIVPGVLVPVVEEAAKAAVIALLVVMMPERNAAIGVGAVMGAAVGLGFTAAENVQYLTLAAIQGGRAGLWRACYVRTLLGGLQHATFAAATGAGFAYARQAQTVKRRWLGATLGLLAAIAQHVLWNSCGARALTDTLCGAAQPGAACAASPEPVALFLIAPLISLVFVVPAVAALYFIVKRLAGTRASSSLV